MGWGLLSTFSARYCSRTWSVFCSSLTHRFRHGNGGPLFPLSILLDAQARLLIPSLPPLRPNDRMSHHFRFIAPLIPMDAEGRSPLHYYDSAIQLARQADREPTEGEFEVGIAAADEIKRMYVSNIFWSVLRETYKSKSVRNQGGNTRGLHIRPHQASPCIVIEAPFIRLSHSIIPPRGIVPMGHASSKTSLNLFLQTHNPRISYLPDYRLKILLDSLAVRSTNSPFNYQAHRLTSLETILSAGAFGLGESRKLRYRDVKVGSFIIQYSLNDGVAARRRQFEASGRSMSRI